MENTKKAGLFENVSEALIETLVVILLGITALLTAWASYTGSIHSGNQATNYTLSNNQASDGNSLYNEAVSNLNQDMQLWSQIGNYQVEALYATQIEDVDKQEEACYKLIWLCADNLSENMAAKIGWDFSFSDSEQVLAWLDTDQATTSPFDEEFVMSYYADSLDKLAESEATLKQGQEDNNNGDRFTLVSVIYSVVLFLLGIIGVFKSKTNKMVVLIISIVALVVGIGFMVMIPLPTSGGIFG